MIYNLYCDESCHLQRDGQPVMVLGAMQVPLDMVPVVSSALRDLKAQYGMSRSFEAKWTKVSPSRVDFYQALIEYFFEQPDLRFRAIVANDKQKLQHESFEQDHDTWYHKMYFEMLRFLITPAHRYRIYIDIKDTRGGAKARTLHNVLGRNIHDFRHEIVERVQILRSDEVEVLQLADLLVGAVSYANRGQEASAAKRQLVTFIEARSGRRLTMSSPLAAMKVNVFQWHPQEVS